MGRQTKYKTTSKRLSMRMRMKKLKNSAVLQDTSNIQSSSTADNQSFISAIEPPFVFDQEYHSEAYMESVEINENLMDSLPIETVQARNSDSARNEGESIFGRRIIHLQHFFNEIIGFEHAPLFSCSSNSLQIVSERKLGLISQFVIKCSMCLNYKKISSDIEDSSTMNINKSATYGIIATGAGYSQLEQLMASCDIPCMSAHTFQNNQELLSTFIKELTWEVIEEAGKKEKELAIAKGHIDADGIPYITVIVDGAWSKRSYKVNYDALSGVGVIIGSETRKVLYIGIRNKYCCVCARANSKGREAIDHTCYKNWSSSSTGMEANIIVQGFQQSIAMHGLKYAFYIGDGDSSVSKKLQQCNPYNDRLIHKIECRNHLLRNYCNKLKELTKKITSSKKLHVPIVERKHLDSNIKRMRTGIQSAIKHNIGLDVSYDTKVKFLRQDIINGPYHYFGDHTNCKAYFCKERENEDMITKAKQSGLFDDVLVIQGRVARNAQSLLANMDNNSAELYNSLVAKYVGGKRVNYSLRNSYETRCDMAALSFNEGPNASLLLYNKLTKNKPGRYLTKFVKSKDREIAWRRARSQQVIRRKRKANAPADAEYGNIENEEHFTEEETKAMCENFMKRVQKTEEEIELIEKKTIGQSDNRVWKEERYIRVTASNFGEICKRKKANPRLIVKRLLGSRFRGNVATNWGKEHEILAVRQYEEETAKKIIQCGLFIDTVYNFLGASPDGLIGDDGIVEIKCPYAARFLTPIDAVQQNIIKYLYIANNQIKLKRSHNYYYQIQGQLHITKRIYCDFIIWTSIGINIERIYKDDSFWNDNMEKKLIKFYNNEMLQELIKIFK